MIGCTRFEVEFDEDRRRVLLDRTVGDAELIGDRGVGEALGHEREDLSLARGERLDRAPKSSEELLDHLGVERGAAGSDPGHRIDELADIGDPFLEEVSDTAGPVGEELARILDLDLLREHEDLRVGVASAQLDRGAEALVGVCRRHAYVDDADVGPAPLPFEKEGLGIVGLTDELHVLVLEQAPETGSKEDGVLDHQHPHHDIGISMSADVPPPSGLVIDKVPSTAWRRS